MGLVLIQGFNDRGKQILGLLPWQMTFDAGQMNSFKFVMFFILFLPYPHDMQE